MKINTDGTLLGALSNAANCDSILDIGAGTGVVALMLAQRFADAKIDAIEIEEHAAVTAQKNFSNSIFASRLNLYYSSFQTFSNNYPSQHYDLIVSNPPFFVNSLKNPDKKKQTARHSDHTFFTELIDFIVNHLTPSGVATLILPPSTATTVSEIGIERGLNISELINVRSFKESEVHRQLISLTKQNHTLKESDFVIYSTQKVYSVQFGNNLRDFFTIF